MAEENVAAIREQALGAEREAKAAVDLASELEKTSLTIEELS